ncbi:nicotinate phosphoribosyltransferase [Nitrococcus mobilis]|uniref:Nicotinate phosphoribosyltransferase n=1 Tax=Nitrococcus mobilis Nb-231 TaxID=314278 RepID=A4BTS7_9GAMM|nr:nicotinate phosphoribosyltransferase [Nitrococcus mobilis]EAR20891.1 nicotinate phosphoribosyltransferase [Nitrococcus mobilis Nb-231]
MLELSRTPLLTDLYELTMLQTYYEHGMTGNAVFEFFVRSGKNPGRRGFYVSAGLEQALEWLERLRFQPAELDWVANCGVFRPEFVDRLAALRFTGDVYAMAEGSVFFPEEPSLRVSAPLPEAQLIESRLMNILHYQTLIATKAARCRLAAQQRNLVDFGLRRAHGGEAGLWAARATYIGGFSGSATCLANAYYGVPVAGTMAHSFILAHPSETEAFLRFARSHPTNVILLIDTYDTEAAARKVVELAPGLSRQGIQIQGVRIDSGNLAEHARRVRAILDEGNLRETAILVSGGLDEHQIHDLVASGAPIDGFGVGSKVNSSADLPFLDSAYKLHQFDGKACGKLSEGKSDLPGTKQIYRQLDTNHMMMGDVIGLEGELIEGQPLLQPVMQEGQRTSAPETLQILRDRLAANVAALPEPYLRLQDAPPFPVVLSEKLRTLNRKLQTHTGR